MSENKSGLRSFLSFPSMHNALQNAVGIPAVRKWAIETNLSVRSGAKVLDIGCGTGELRPYLPNNIDYTGFDIEEKYINYAKKKFGNKGKFFVGNANSIEQTAAGQYDIILLFSILHHLSDEEASVLLNSVYQLLGPGGVALSLDGVFLEDQSKMAKYVLSNDRGRYVRTQEGYTSIVRSSFIKYSVQIKKGALRIPTDLITIKMTK